MIWNWDPSQQQQFEKRLRARNFALVETPLGKIAVRLGYRGADDRIITVERRTDLNAVEVVDEKRYVQAKRR